VVLLKLATTWCPTCKQLSAEIDKIGEFLKEQDVVFLEVFVQDSKKMIEKFLGDTEPPMTFHALLDDGQAYEAYSVYLIPRFLVIDAEQIVRFDSAGRNVSAADITSMVEEFGGSPEGDGAS
jgi:thiol-disulfide isomerase/thioredoxin